jgi:hypothetical protein
MRRLATDLDVAVMSLYRYVPGKDELVLLMAESVFGEVPLPDGAGTDWRGQIEAVVRAQWAMVKRHPWLPSVTSFTRPMMVPAGMAQTDRIMGVVRGLGFDSASALHITVALAGLMLGVGASVQLEAEAQRETGVSSDEWMERQPQPAGFPHLESIAEVPGYDMSLDAVFETGLGLLLDGLAQRLPQKRVRSSRSMPRSAS